MLDENVDILNAHDRKQRKSFFRAIHDGDFDDVVGYNAPSMFHFLLSFMKPSC